jgi:hypothetical protein
MQIRCYARESNRYTRFPVLYDLLLLAIQDKSLYRLFFLPFIY